MPSGAFIQDQNMRINILTGQSLGVASQDPSSLQIFLDRRLDQDDNRGMEQAMTDNILTSSKFIIFFEEMNEKNFDKSIGKNHPSLLSQKLSFNLINPIIKLVSNQPDKDNAEIKLKNINLTTRKSFPCDLRLVNLRTMQKKNEQPLENEVGLILHRIAHAECPSNQAVKENNFIKNQCSSGFSKLSFIEFFEYFIETGSFNELKISSTYLTLQNKETSKNKIVDPNDMILSHIQPMQIEAFKVNL